MSYLLPQDRLQLSDPDHDQWLEELRRKQQRQNAAPSQLQPTLQAPPEDRLYRQPQPFSRAALPLPDDATSQPEDLLRNALEFGKAQKTAANVGAPPSAAPPPSQQQAHHWQTPPEMQRLEKSAPAQTAPAPAPLPPGPSSAQEQAVAPEQTAPPEPATPAPAKSASPQAQVPPQAEASSPKPATPTSTSQPPTPAQPAAPTQAAPSTTPAPNQPPTAAPAQPRSPAAPQTQAPSQSPPASQPPPQPQSTSQPQPKPTDASTAPDGTEYDPRVLAAMKEAAAQVEAEAAIRRQREARRAKLESAGMGGTATSLDALDDEAAARRTELAKQHPQRGPEYEAGIHALDQHLQQQRSQIAAKAKQLPHIAAHIYQQWGHGVAGNWITGVAPKEGDEYSPGAPLSSTHLSILDQEAQKYGVDPKDLRHHLEMLRLSDWSRPSTRHANWQQENLVNKVISNLDGRGPAEPARVLPDGRITVNPTLGEDKAAFEKAIAQTQSSPEAKEAARQMWPAYHDAWLTHATQTLQTAQTLPGVESYQTWIERNTQAGWLSKPDSEGGGLLSPNEMTQRYLDAMKARPGWRKLADNISSSLVAGGGHIIAAGMGLAAMTAGSIEALTGLDVGGQAFSEAAADKARENSALTQDHALTGTTDGFGTRLTSSVFQALPAAVTTMITGGGTAGAAIMSALQTAGGQYAQTYASNIQGGMQHDEAFARSATAATFSGVMSGILTKAFPGGVTALNSSAIRSTLSTSAGGSALRGSITDAIKAYAATTAHGAQALARGALDEIPQEVLDEGISQLSAAWAEKKDMKQAMAEFFTGLPQLIATSGLLGAGGQHIAQSNGKQPQTGQQPPQNQIPANTTPGDSATSATPSDQPSPTSSSRSDQPSQSTANNSQPPQTSPTPAKPSRPPLDVETSKKLIANVEARAKKRPLNPVEQADLDQARQVVAEDEARKAQPSGPPPSVETSLARIHNIMNRPPEARQHPTTQAHLAQAQQVVQEQVQKLEGQQEPLSNAQKQELADAKAALARLDPESVTAQSENGPESKNPTPRDSHQQNNIPNTQDSTKDTSEGSQSDQDDIDTFSDHWNPPLKSPEEILSQAESDDDIQAASDDQKKSRDLDGEDELPYWKEYYDEVGREKENLDTLLKSIQAHGEIMKGPDHLGINIEESNQARYIPTKDHKGQIVGHTITHGPSTKKWELMEEFAHYRVTQGWNSAEIKALKAKLDKGIRMPTGRWEKMKDTAAVAEEIIIKQHLIDHAASLKPADKKVLQNQINQLLRYGFSKKY